MEKVRIAAALLCFIAAALLAFVALLALHFRIEGELSNGQMFSALLLFGAPALLFAWLGKRLGKRPTGNPT